MPGEGRARGGLRVVGAAAALLGPGGCPPAWVQPVTGQTATEQATSSGSLRSHTSGMPDMAFNLALPAPGRRATGGPH
jgi:hypothetical protein